jgi:DNA-binding beta-propeller fold protein YncE
MRTHFLWVATLPLLFFGCKPDDPTPTPDPVETTERTVFVSNEGQFQVGNASLTLYDPSTQAVQTDAFQAANGRFLGDIFQSMTFWQERAYLVINNSNLVEVIDPTTLASQGTITGPTSPRYLLPLGDGRAYLTDLYAGAISIVDLEGQSLTGQIPTPGAWTEQLVASQGQVFLTCYQRPYLYVIDPSRDQISDSIAIETRGLYLAEDANGHIWVSTGASISNDEPGALFVIDPSSREVVRSLPFPTGEGPGELAFNPGGDTLFYLSGDLYALPIQANVLPTEPFIEAEAGSFYGMGVDQNTGEIYLTDPIDFVQRGQVLRFTAAGSPVDTFRAGVGPAGVYVRGE